MVALMLVSSVGIASQARADDIYGSHSMINFNEAKPSTSFMEVRDPHLTPLEDMKEGAILIDEALLDDIGGSIQIEKTAFGYESVEHSGNYGSRNLQGSVGDVHNVAKVLLKATTGAKTLANDAKYLGGRRKLQESPLMPESDLASGEIDIPASLRDDIYNGDMSFDKNIEIKGASNGGGGGNRRSMMAHCVSDDKKQERDCFHKQKRDEARTRRKKGYSHSGQEHKARKFAHALKKHLGR